MMITKLFYLTYLEKNFARKFQDQKIFCKITTSSNVEGGSGRNGSAKGGSGSDSKIAASASLNIIPVIHVGINKKKEKRKRDSWMKYTKQTNSKIKYGQTSTH